MALCLTIFEACSPKDKGEVVLKKTSEAFEKTKIKAGLDKIGIGEGYEIVIANNPDIVENTAAEELKKFLGKGGFCVRSSERQSRHYDLRCSRTGWIGFTHDSELECGKIPSVFCDIFF